MLLCMSLVPNGPVVGFVACTIVSGAACEPTRFWVVSGVIIGNTSSKAGAERTQSNSVIARNHLMVAGYGYVPR